MQPIKTDISMVTLRPVEFRGVPEPAPIGGCGRPGVRRNGSVLSPLGKAGEPARCQGGNGGKASYLVYEWLFPAEPEEKH